MRLRSAVWTDNILQPILLLRKLDAEKNIRDGDARQAIAALGCENAKRKGLLLEQFPGKIFPVLQVVRSFDGRFRLD